MPMHNLYQYWRNLATKKQRLIKIVFLAASIVVSVLLILTIAYNIDNENIIKSYAHDSVKSTIQAKKLKFKPQVYSSDIDNVHMITPYELQNYRQTALKRGYDE